ncbi:hypothetical protein G9A89_005188 [Geosiphon pyriformis]|nr:hypothetical protein G9A89_005188 [Geosiphon pyriformis]
MDKTITTESLSIIQRTQPKPSDKHTFRLPSSTTALSTKLQQLQQQLQLPIQQQQLIVPMAFAPIAKLEKFTAITANNWNDTRTIQVILYFLKNTANLWYHSLAQKPQNFNAFKTKFLRYFSDNNSINYLASTFTTLKQGDIEAFIRDLCSSILQQVHSMHLVDLSTAVTYTRDFEAAELKANHAQAVNLVMNGSSDLDFKLKQFIPNSESLLESKSISIYLFANDAATNLSNTSISTSNISTAATHNISTTTINSNTATKPITQNWRLVIVVHQLIPSLSNQLLGSHQWSSGTGYNQNPSFQNYLSFLVIPKDAASSKQETNQKPLIRNILSATSTKDKSLVAIFPFELEKITLVLLFSRATLDTKPITAMYTDVKVNGQDIKLILNNRSAGSIIIKQLMNQLGHQVDRTVSARIITANKTTKTLIGDVTMATTPDTATLEYYQLIYTHCKQRFNIPDGIEIVKKSIYQYIENCINNYLFGNYNISEVKSNLYNNLVHYSHLGTEDLNSETLATYFQELNFNIIKYCEEKYPVQSKYSFDFESETETSNKGKQRLKQYSRTTPNTPTLQKTTAKHLQTPEQGTSVKLPLSITPFPISLVQPQTLSSPLSCFFRPEDFQSPRNSTQQQEPISTSANIIDYLQENESNHSESLESKETESEPEKIPKNKEEMATAYIAKIPEFTGEDNDTSPQEWLDKVQKAGDANGWIAARMLKAIPYFLQETAREWFENLEKLFENWQAFKNAFLQQFTDNNTSITLRNHFRNIKQETSESFIVGLKDKLIKKVHPHASADLATAIRQAKSYEMAMKEANHTKLVNLAIGETTTSQTNNNSHNNHKDINPHNDTTKTILDYHPITNLKIVIIVEFQDTGNEIVGNYKETNKTGVINVTLYHNNPITNLHHQLIIHQGHKIKTVTIHQLHNQCSNNISNLYQFSHIRHHPLNNIKPNHYHIQPSYLTIPEESDFQQTTLSESEIAAPRSNFSNHTIPPAQIAQNANLSDIFPFEFEANESPFLLSNAAVNKQKAITAMYTEATVEGKSICLILNSGSAGSIITYQLMQQLKQNIDRPAQTVIVTADGMKKTPVGEIDDFSFSIDGITILVKVLVMDAPQYQALVGNDWLFKTNANLN